MNYGWVNKVIEDSVAGKQFKRRIQTGIDHLENKKLYKYYSFSSEYTIPNLQNNVIYLQNPVLFNDPFDCNIGISVNQLIRVLMPNFFDKILPNTSNEVRDVLGSWLLGNTTSELEEGSKERLLSICANSSAIVKLINRSKNGEVISDQEVLSALIEDPDTISEMIKTYLSIVSNGEPISFDDIAMQQVLRSPQLVKSVIMSFGDQKDTKEKQLLELLASKDDFFAKIESIATFSGVDIPRSEIARVYSLLDDGIKQIRIGLGKQVGIECFTQSPTDILMWSYYADKHTGICVEYDFSKLFFSLPNAFLFPVYYSESRPLLNLEAIYNPETKQICNDRAVEAFPGLMWSWITKSLEWDREKEWRLISFPIKDDAERSAKLPIISRIITGINISDENYEIAAGIAKEKGVPIHRTRLKNDQYKIEIINEDTV